MKHFEKFMASPYFNNGRNFKPLYKILKPFHPSFDNSNLTEEKIFQKLYHGKVFDKKSSVSIRVLFSQMTSMAEEFITIEALKSNDGKIMTSRAFSFSLLKRGLYNESLKAALKNFEIHKKGDLDWTNFESLIIINLHISTSYLNLNRPIDSLEIQNNIPFYFFAFAFAEMTNFISNYINIKRRYNYEVRGIKSLSHFLDSFEPDVFDKEFKEDEIGTKKYIFLNYYLCKALLDNYDEVSLNYALELFKNIYERLLDSHGYFSRLHNVCKTRAYEIDFQKYGRMDNMLSNFAWGKDLYKGYSGRFLGAVAYDSIFEFKIPFLNPKQLKIFIDKYVVEIYDDAREEMKNYSYAWVYFKQKEFDKVLDLLSRIQIVDISFKDNVYKLKIAALISLELYDEALLTVDAYEHYLNNNRNVSEFIKNSGKCFSSSIKALVKAFTFSTGDFEINSLIEKNKNSLFGKWFREKVDEIKLRLEIRN